MRVMVSSVSKVLESYGCRAAVRYDFSHTSGAKRRDTFPFPPGSAAYRVRTNSIG